MRCMKGESMSQKQAVLIVDDEALIASALSWYLSDKGYDVKAVTSPVTALSMMDNERFDIVITDVRMVPVSGVEFVDHLRRSGFNGKIIMVSGFFGGIEKELRELRVDAFLEKNFEYSSLLKVIRA